jgi:adenylylsulfate kinase-like enzyme
MWKLIERRKNMIGRTELKPTLETKKTRADGGAPTPAIRRSLYGVCIWLSSTPTSLASEIGRALYERLTPHLRRVEQLGIENDPGLGSGYSPFENRRNLVAYLGHTAGLLVRHGFAVIVAFPLFDREGQRIARESAGRMVEVSVGPAPRSEPAEDVVIFRYVQNGQVVEREVPIHQGSPRLRPDVVVDGTLRPPTEVAADIFDTLVQAGWIRLPGSSSGAAQKQRMTVPELLRVPEGRGRLPPRALATASASRPPP